MTPTIDHDHVDAADRPALSTYATIPPASGPHDPSPLTAGIYETPPDVYRTIHSLEHGAVIIWYDADISSQALDDLLAFYGQPFEDNDIGQAKIIIAPYDYPDQGPAGQLPAGVQMAMVAWHRLQLCSSVSLPVAFDFSSRFEVPGFGWPDVRGRCPRAQRLDLADGEQAQAQATPPPERGSSDARREAGRTAETGGANTERRERKEQARQAKEAARKRARRSARVRRLTTFAVIGVVGVGLVYFFQRAASPREIPQFAIDAATAAGCSQVAQPLASAPGSQHLDPGESTTYPQQPATSGFHDTSPLAIPPRVYTEPIPETQAVHNLEHGAAIMYYRQSGDGALPQRSSTG